MDASSDGMGFPCTNEPDDLEFASGQRPDRSMPGRVLGGPEVSNELTVTDGLMSASPATAARTASTCSVGPARSRRKPHAPWGQRGMHVLVEIGSAPRMSRLTCPGPSV
jgi:hypothetical protein